MNHKKMILLFLLLIGSSISPVTTVSYFFEMETPPTGATQFDTRNLAKKGDCLEQMASRANRYLGLPTAMQDGTFVYTGDTAANTTKIQADLALQFVEILHLSEECVGNMLNDRLQSAFNSVIRSSDQMKGKLEGILSGSKAALSGFLTSPNKVKLEEQSRGLKQTIENLKGVGNLDLVTNTTLQAFINKMEDIKINVDVKTRAADTLLQVFQRASDNGEYKLNSTAASNRELVLMRVRDLQVAFGKIRANFQRSFNKDAIQTSNLWIDPTKQYLPTVDVCPVRGDTIFVGVRQTSAANNALINAAVTSALGGTLSLIESLNITLTNTKKSSDTLEVICDNLKFWTQPNRLSTSQNRTKIRLEDLRNSIADIVFTISLADTFFKTADVTAEQAMRAEVLLKLAEEYKAIGLMEISNSEKVDFEALKSMVVEAFTAANSLRMEMSLITLNTLKVFYAATPTNYQVPFEFEFPLDVEKYTAFVNTFKLPVATSAKGIFYWTRQLNLVETKFATLLNTTSSYLSGLFSNSTIFSLLEKGMAFPNTVIRPMVDIVTRIDRDLIEYTNSEVVLGYQVIQRRLDGILEDIENEKSKITQMTSNLMKYETASKLNLMRTMVANEKLGVLMTSTQSKLTALLTSIAALTPIPIVTYSPAPTAPSATTVYRSFVIQFNHTNCFNVSNADIKATADPLIQSYYCPIDIRLAAQSSTPKFFVSTLWRNDPQAPLSNGVTSLPSANPLLINLSTNAALDGTDVNKKYLRVPDGSASAFKEYTIAVKSASKSMVLFEVTLPVLLLPVRELVDGNQYKDLAQYRPYAGLHLNLTTFPA